MKKIMFDDQCGLTQAVLDGCKTMTRRIVTEKQIKHALFVQKEYGISLEEAILKYTTPYLIWEEIAIAQNYKDANVTLLDYLKATDNKGKGYDKGCSNKEFVKADLMPHHIRITNIRVERLQDISDEDCLREGIEECSDILPFRYMDGNRIYHNSFTPYEAFTDLFKKVSGKGTWERNPWVFVYEFELVD